MLLQVQALREMRQQRRNASAVVVLAPLFALQTLILFFVPPRSYLVAESFAPSSTTTLTITPTRRKIGNTAAVPAQVLDHAASDDESVSSYPSSSSSSSSSSSTLLNDDENVAASAVPSSTVASSSPQPQQRQWYQDPDMMAYAAGYTTVFDEVPFQICEPSLGTLPMDLQGSYYRVGPAMFSAGSIVPPKTSIVQPKSPPVPDGVDPTRMVLHPMEGDGAIVGITFTTSTSSSTAKTTDEPDDNDDESTDHPTPVCVMRYRYVRTPGFTNERKKGQRLYTGMDATRQMKQNGGGDSLTLGLANDVPLPLFRHHYQPGLNKLRKHAANTRAIYWAQRLFCLWEGGLPYKLDGRALGTEGRSQLGGAVKKDADPFGGVMAIDSTQHRALFYGISHGPQASELTLYEFNSQFRLVQPHGRRSFAVPGFLLVNDFAVTRQYAVFVVPTVKCNAMQFLLNKDPGKTVTIDKGGTILLVPRAENSKDNQIQSIPIPSDHLTEANVQVINAYHPNDDDPKIIVLDVIRSDASHKKTPSSSSSNKWPWATSLEEYRNTASVKSLWRYTVNLTTNSVSKQPLVVDRHVDFATFNPQVSAQRHQYLYMNVGATRNSRSSGDAGGTNMLACPPQGILKFHVNTGRVDEWMPQPYEFCGEPMFAPRTRTSSSDNNSNAKDETIREDDGYILSILFNGKARQSELLILDATDIASGPIARIPLGMAIPHGYYGCFASTHQQQPWTPDEMERRAKLHDKMESRGNYWNEVKSDFSGLGLRLDDMEEYFGDLFT